MNKYEQNAIKETVVFTLAKIGDAQVNSVDARTLHKALGSKKQFGDWIKAKVLANTFFTENLDYVKIEKTAWLSPHQKVMAQPCGSPPASANRQDYALTMDTAKKVAMSEQTQRGEEVRNYFLECEKQAIARNYTDYQLNEHPYAPGKMPVGDEDSKAIAKAKSRIKDLKNALLLGEKDLVIAEKDLVIHKDALVIAEKDLELLILKQEINKLKTDTSKLPSVTAVKVKQADKKPVTRKVTRRRYTVDTDDDIDPKNFIL